VKYKDYYNILGVDRTADQETIRKAYRKLARKYHPDFNPGNREAEERFKDLQEAYAVLSDAEKRRQYDQLGTGWQAGSEFTPPPGWGARFDFGGGPVEDFFGQTGGFSDFFQFLFGGMRPGGRAASARQAARETAAHPGAGDIEADIELSLEDIHRGARPTLSVHTSSPCPDCGGQGSQGLHRCVRCGGAGTVEHRRRLTVNIAPGARSGTVLKLAGKGESTRPGGPAGDLYLRIRVKPHPTFEVVGEDDLQVELPVTPWEAALGTKLKVPTLDGQVEMTVPPGSQSGTKLRLRGQGLRTRDGNRGDLFVKLRIEIPTRLTAEEEQLLRRLAEVSRFRPRRD
jgi:DnaJ-class molecular chaperone